MSRGYPRPRGFFCREPDAWERGTGVSRSPMNSQQTHDSTAPVDPAAAARRAAAGTSTGGGFESATAAGGPAAGGPAAGGPAAANTPGAGTGRMAADETLTDEQSPTQAFKAIGARF